MTIFRNRRGDASVDVWQVRPWTFFEGGVVGHVSMAEPYDRSLSQAIHTAISKPGVLEGENVKVHDKSTIICIGEYSTLLLITVLTLSHCFTRGTSVLHSVRVPALPVVLNPTADLLHRNDISAGGQAIPRSRNGVFSGMHGDRLRLMA